MEKRLHHLLTDDERATVRAPIDRARTLPNKAFTCPNFFELELEKVGWNNWAAIGFTGQVPKSGDVAPIEAFGIPLLLLRDEAGALRVFHNVSPYDGCPLVLHEQSGRSDLVSPYHGWVYSLEGELLSIPYWDGTVEGNVASISNHERDLKELQVETRFGVVFVNISGTAEPFHDFIASFDKTLSEFDPNSLQCVAEADGVAHVSENLEATNWKQYNENFSVNILHESFTHALYNKSPEVPRMSASGEKKFRVHEGHNMFGFSYDVDHVQKTYGLPPLPHIGFPGAPPKRGHFAFLYPNLSAAVMQSLIVFTIAMPIAPDQTKLLTTYHFHPDTIADESFDQLLEGLAEGFGEAAVEDGHVMAAIQKARRSPAFGSQFYSPYWDEGYYRYNNRLLDDLER